MADEKLKILYLKDLLMETDEQHALNATQLCDRMKERHGYSYDRRTIYTDIKRLVKYGIRIGQKKGASFGYYVKEHPFELPELKLLVDAVQSSRFITKEKSEGLIRKLGKQTTNENAAELQRHVFILNRIKADNDAIYTNVDRFGTDIMIREHGNDRFHVSVTVSVSPQFFGWLAGLGKGIRISWPEDVRSEYKAYLNEVARNA